MRAKIVSLLVLAVATACVQASDWRGRLRGGGDVRVDPDSNRAMLYRGGAATPLWDGTHYLDDGSVLIIRDGIATPRQDMLQSRRARRRPPPWQGATIVGPSPCQTLVRRVCGAHDECADTRGCSPARQLLDMEQQERAAAANHGVMSFTSGQCQYALRDRVYFAACPQR